MRIVVFGLGGFDPKKPNGNIVEEYDVPDTSTTLQVDLVALASALATAPELSDETKSKLIDALGTNE